MANFRKRVGRCQGTKCGPEHKEVATLISTDHATGEETEDGWWCQPCNPALWLTVMTDESNAPPKPS